MPSVVLIVPGSLDTRTGGYGYDRRIVSGLRDRGWTVDARQLGDSFPFPTPQAREEASRVLAAIPDGATVLVDGLALGALPTEIERETPRLRIVGLVHHPLAAETGIAEDAAAGLEISERRALAAVHSVVVTSRTTARVLQQRYAVAAERITVVEPGTDPAPLARAFSCQPPPSSPEPRGASPHPPVVSPQPPAPSPLSLLCVATLTPRKGHDLLFHALASIPQRNWQLICAGSVDRDRATTMRLRAQLRAEGLEDRVLFAGDLDAAALEARYAAADLFVLATLYEGYGMAVAEALARGLPVISTATGAIEELVAGSDPPAGMVLPPGDLGALTQALARVLGDADLRARLAHGARLARARLPRWDDSCAKMAVVLERASRAHATGFSAGWLALREPADHAARSLSLTRALAAALPAAPSTRVLDLGAGTGSNLRYLAARLSGEQHWLLVDRDAALLARAAQQSLGDDESAIHVEVRDVDLATLADPSTRQLFDGRALVTASALLDLVSEEWICTLATRCRERGAAVLFALSYDGRIHCAPEEAGDEMVRDLVNRHQRTDKGFGSALGPDATAAAARAFAGAGYQVRREQSDWTLTPEQGTLQRELIEGWADAARLMAPERAAAIDGWRIRRLAHVDAQRSRLTVGHEDLAAWLSTST